MITAQERSKDRAAVPSTKDMEQTVCRELVKIHVEARHITQTSSFDERTRQGVIHVQGIPLRETLHLNLRTTDSQKKRHLINKIVCRTTTKKREITLMRERESTIYRIRQRVVIWNQIDANRNQNIFLCTPKDRSVPDWQIYFYS